MGALSLLWTQAGLSTEQHQALSEVAALPGDVGRPHMASGEPVRRLMAKYGITQHVAAPHIDDAVEVNHDYSLRRVDPDEELHTSQQHLWKPALEQYIREGHEHLMDPDHANEDHESDVPYHPQVYSHGDMDWIDEGHHRILAKRMLGEPVDAYHGWTDGRDSGQGWD